MTQPPAVSVVVPARDGAGVLPRLMRALADQTLGRRQFEVVVVSNGSRDRTAAIARGWGAVAVEDAVGNRSRARNLGAARARAGLLAFTDVDCVPAPGWLEGLLACRGRAPLTAGWVHVSTGSPPNGVERFEMLWRFSQEAWVAQGWAATANLAVERSAFEAVGGFDPAYRQIGEDVDFCLRARAGGLALAYCADAVVHHDPDDRIAPLLSRFYRHGYGTTQLHRRLGAGYDAWRRPQALLGDEPLRLLGLAERSFATGERRRMLRLARMGYAARMAGSLAAEAHERVPRRSDAAPPG